MTKASIAADTPNRLACSMSRAKPASRDNNVIALQTAVERSTPGGSEEHTSGLQSLMRTSYADFCLKKKKTTKRKTSKESTKYTLQKANTQKSYYANNHMITKKTIDVQQ